MNYTLKWLQSHQQHWAEDRETQVMTFKCASVGQVLNTFDVTYNFLTASVFVHLPATLYSTDATFLGLDLL